MPKVSGSYQGVTMQPQFPNYQTAGMLRPAPAPTTPASSPPTTPTTTPPAIDFPVPSLTPPTTQTGNPTSPTPPVTEDRTRLVNAVMGGAGFNLRPVGKTNLV